MSQPIWDDEHTGDRWRYGLSHRPVGYGTVPDGWILQSDGPHPDFAFGTIDYLRELTAQEVEGYELTPLKS